jgi:putative tryptophan/tyrosine transport system substrate-binding protein
VKRREFIVLLGGTVSWAFAVRAQQTVRRVAVLMVHHEADQLGQSRLKAFVQAFDKLGWAEGHNAQIIVRWAGGSAERMREIAAEFVALKPDLILASGTPAVAALKRTTASIPIVFVGINEPVVQGFIASMARPGGNITGFTQVDFSVVGKSVEMLTAMAPALTRVSLMYNPETCGFYDSYLEKFRAEARWPVDLSRAAVRAPEDIVTAVAGVAARPGGGLAVLSDAFNTINQATIRTALERYPVPHIVPWRQFVVQGGLMSYGPDADDIFRRSASYADCILMGANPADLPAQAPTQFELAINLKAAKALGLTVPPSLLAVAEEVIE